MLKLNESTKNIRDDMKYLRTSDIARAAGVHENTVRRYVDFKFLPPVERAENGYRLFTPDHLGCMRLARLVLGGDYAGKAIRQSGYNIIFHAAKLEFFPARELAQEYLQLVKDELGQAEAAASILEDWAKNQIVLLPDQKEFWSIGQAAKRLSVTIDMLRFWERNGLLSVPRNPDNGYRHYGQAEIDRARIIRMLSRAGYSQMAILRMMLRLDRGEIDGLREALDTPEPDEDAYLASDHWLSTLHDHLNRAEKIITLLKHWPDFD